MFRSRNDTTSKVKLIENQGNVTLSDWVTTKSGANTFLFPTHVQYVKEWNGTEKIDPEKQAWFQVTLSPTEGIKSVDVTRVLRPGPDDKATVQIEGDVIKPGQNLPSWATGLVYDDLLPWLGQLVKSNFQDALITRDENRKVVFVDRAGVHVYWCAGEAGFTNVEIPGKHQSLQLTATEEILYFEHKENHVGVKFHGERLVTAWRRPLKDTGAKYTDYSFVPPDVKTAAHKLSRELKAMLAEAEKLKTSADTE